MQAALSAATTLDKGCLQHHSGVVIDSDGPVIRLCFDRPPVNAFTIAMFEDLARIFAEIRTDLRPVLLSGANGMFSAGYDIKQENAPAESAGEAARACLSAIQSHNAPVVAAVEGAAVGLGMVMATSADILIVSRVARLRMPEITLGITSDVAPLRRFLPDPWVRRVCLLGEVFTADQLKLDCAGAHLCEPGETQRVASEIFDSMCDINARFLADTKRRLYDF